MFFDLLEQHQLFLKLAKCEFFQTEMDYLRIHVKEGELMIDPAKNFRNYGLAYYPYKQSKKSKAHLDFSDITALGSLTSQKS